MQKGTERKFIELFITESEKIIAKIQLQVDSSVNSSHSF